MTPSSDRSREQAREVGTPWRTSGVEAVTTNFDAVLANPAHPERPQGAQAQPPSRNRRSLKHRRPMRGFAIPCPLRQLYWWFAVQALYAASMGSTFAKPANDNALRGAR